MKFGDKSNYTCESIANECWKVGCRGKSIYSPGGKMDVMFCSRHMSMDCSTSRVCNNESCDKPAICGYKNISKNVPMTCLTHKFEGMIITKYQKCKLCDNAATHSKTGKCGVYSYCESHMLKHMVKIKYQCNYYGCSEIPIWNKSTQKHPLMCNRHKNMIK